MYDLAIIGGGPAGYSAALQAVKNDLSVILFEHDKMGGTCLNRGCVPTKFFAHVADLYADMNTSSRYGIFSEKVSIDYEKAQIEKERILQDLRTGLEQKMIKSNIEIVHDKAVIVEKNVIETSAGRYSAKHILVATGSNSVEPFVENALSTNEILELKTVPDSIKIIGGGVVAVEFAYIFSSLGSKVTMCIRGERILRRWDKEIATSLALILKKNGVTIKTKCTQEEMNEIGAEVVLSAVGRKAYYEELFQGGFLPEIEEGIIVDDFGRTSIEGIFAAGDVISGSTQLAHVAMEQGKRVADYIAGKKLCEPAVVVNCIYTQMEIASIGVTEAEAKECGRNIAVAKQTMYANARTLISTGERGFIKLIAEADTGILIGAHLMCERASDIASELALAINQKMTVESIVSSVRPHPSFCEEVTGAAESLLEKLS